MEPTGQAGQQVARTSAQHLLNRYRDKFIAETHWGGAIVDLFQKGNVGAWRFEKDTNHRARWWINVTLPAAVAQMFDFGLEILVLYTELERVEPRTLAILQSKLRNDVRVEPGVAVVVSRDPNVGQMANRRRGELSVIAITLDEMAADDRDFRSRIASVVSAVDHFDLTNPVRNPIGFFGRSRELDVLRESLDRGQSVGIFGLRKAGKTSLMNSLQQLRGEAGSLIVKIDISEVSSAEEFRLKLIERTWRAIRNLDPQIAMPRLKLLNQSGETKADPDTRLHWVDDLERLLAAAPRRLELFIDEIDQAYPARSTLDAVDAGNLFQTLTQLRGLVQAGERVVLLCAGVDPGLFEQPVFEDRDNLLYKLVRLMWLSPMSRDETAEMVRGLGKRMGVRARDYRVIDRLYEEYGGHPLLTRKACSLAVRGRSPEDLPFEISQERVEQAIAARGFDSPNSQAVDVLRSFEKWFPSESQLLGWLLSSDLEEATLAQSEALENPDALAHAVAYGLCNADLTPRIRAVSNAPSERS